MSRTALPAHPQGEDDLKPGAQAGGPPRHKDPTGPPQAHRAPVAGGHALASERGADHQQQRARSARGARAPRQLSLPSGPPILNPPSDEHTSPAAHTRDTLRSLLTSAGFGPRARALDPNDIWRPAVGFAALCAAIVLAASAFAGHHVGHGTITPYALLTLAVVLLCEVALVTRALALAASATGRTLALAAGTACALVSATFILFGVRAGIAVSILCLIVIGMGVRQSIDQVADGAVHVTTLPGGRHRTLLPGLNILLPGEHVLAVLSTQPRTHQTLPEHVARPGGLEAEAAISVQYALLPAHADRAIAATRDWERVLRRQISGVLRDELTTFLTESAPAATPSGGPRHAPTAAPSDPSTPVAPAEEELRARIHQRLRREAASQGIDILAVTVREVMLSDTVWAVWRSTATAEQVGAAGARESAAPAAPSPHAEVPTATSAPPRAPALTPALAGPGSQPAPISHEPRVAAQAYANALQERVGELAQGLRRLVGARQPSDPEPDIPAPVPAPVPALGPRRSAPDSPHAPQESDSATTQPAVRALSARTLAAMYEAVEEERVTDPVTIRHIAEAFGQYVPAPGDEGALSFDPQEVARDLLHRLAQQAAPADSEPSARPETDAPLAPPDAQADARSQPQPPASEDNILRGG
jgi:hypothetical protein